MLANFRGFPFKARRPAATQEPTAAQEPEVSLQSYSQIAAVRLSWTVFRLKSNSRMGSCAAAYRRVVARLLWARPISISKRGHRNMPFSIQRRLGRASCSRALLFSVGLVAGCAQNQSVTNSSGSGGSSGGTAAGTGGSGSGGFQNVGSAGSVASGGSSGAAGVIGSGGIVGSGGSVITGTGGTGTGGTGVGGFSTGGSGTGGSAAGGAAGGGTGGATGGIGGASAGTSGGSAGAGARPAPSADPTTFGLNGPSKCAAGNFAICEDFEATAVGAMPTGWTKEGTWATVVSTGDKARGNQSLQISVGTANN